MKLTSRLKKAARTIKARTADTSIEVILSDSMPDDLTGKPIPLAEWKAKYGRLHPDTIIVLGPDADQEADESA